MNRWWRTLKVPNKGHFGTSHFVISLQDHPLLGGCKGLMLWERVCPLLGGCSFLGESLIIGCAVIVPCTGIDHFLYSSCVRVYVNCKVWCVKACVINTSPRVVLGTSGALFLGNYILTP